MEELKIGGVDLTTLTWETVLPFLNMTPAEILPWVWACLPGAVFGLLVAMLLVYLRSYAVRVHHTHTAAQIVQEPWYMWPFYILRRLSAWYFIAVGISLAVEGMPFAESVKDLVALLFRLLTVLQAAMLISAFVQDGVASYFRGHDKLDGGRKMIINALKTVGILLIWAIALLTALNAIGINVTALVAGLGLGGVAIAFATKNLLENVLASFSMVLNPPFVIGDFIITNGMMGTVQEITLKNVKIRSLSGEMLFIPSSELMNSRIANYAYMKERRVELKFGVGYENMDGAKLGKIPQIIKKAIEAQKDRARFDRAHLAGYGDDLIRFEAIYIVKTGDYNTYMDVQQAILIDIYRDVEKLGVGLGLSDRVGALGDILAQPERIPTSKKSSRSVKKG